MKYCFYYDESEHSRVINLSTVTGETYYDGFLAAIIGWRSDHETAFEQRYQRLALVQVHGYDSCGRHIPSMEKGAGERLRLFTFRIFRLSVDSLLEQYSHANKPRCELHRQIVQSVG